MPIEKNICSLETPIDISFNNLIPCVSGNIFAIFCKNEGNNSYGIVAPDKNNIGK